jgi:hypothetical protein
LCNLLIRPVNPKHHMTEEGLARERAASPAKSSTASAAAPNLAPATASYGVPLVLAWTAVALPLAWGVWITLSKAVAFFK